MNLTNRFQKISKWLLTTTSVFTMVMLPVAQGQAAQAVATEITKSQVQNAVIELGLNKSMTLGEFYRKNKKLYPERVRNELEKFISENKDYAMPLFEVTTAKNSEGKEIPAVRISKDGELVNIQIFGEKEKYVKLNNTNLTESDIINFKDMFLKLNNGDANLRKQVEKTNLTTTAKGSNQFTGFPAITKEIWSTYSAREKAEYILNMRQLWSDAQKVLSSQDKKNSKKTSQFEFFWNKLVQDVEAQAAKAAPKAPRPAASVVKKDSGTTAAVSSENCLVAGYVSKYSNGSCGVKALQDSYKDESGNVNPVVSKAQGQCKSGQLACNPFVYGMPNGNAICVDTQKPEFQIATHANGPCDTASPLGSSVDFLNKDLKNKDRYSAENLKLNPEQLAEVYKKQQKENSAYVENYLKGFLGAGIDFNKEIDATVLQQILNIKSAFDNDIATAQKSCKSAAENKYNEKNFWGACDQLQRRFLFVAEFLKEKPGCKDGSEMNSSTLKCVCKDSKKSEVAPGAKCPAPETPAPTSGKCPTGMSDDSTGGSLQCLCTNGSPGNWTLEQTRASGFDAKASCSSKPNPAPGVSTSSDTTRPPAPGSCVNGTIERNDNGAEVCVPNKPAKPEKEKESWFHGLFKKALPWLVGGVALFAMYKLWSPKKPTLNGAGDYCANGTIPPCVQVCAAPLANINGICGCAACPPGQTLTNAATCTCSTSTTTPTQVTCPDGVTKAATLAQCPATQYTCWDGSKVTNPINCPERPATTSSGSGSSGK